MRRRWTWEAVLGVAVIAIATQMSLHAAFNEELAHDLGAAGAERYADRDLALAGRGARQEEIRDVGARDKQYHADQALQH